MSSLFGGKQQQQALPPPPPLPTPPPSTIDAPEIQGAAAAERLRLRQRKGRSSTILTGGALIPPESGGTGTLLGGSAR